MLIKRRSPFDESQTLPLKFLTSYSLALLCQNEDNLLPQGERSL
ncbi:hypothetical protein [Halotia branconii]|uniref:Uncharacterized protein n=1 Tax=Halotia branconii CENA392 TaxID=1539056 RepID=A0AAJ6NWW8_9CYAN|nr:hypothetical protein [Halotia branconii]WGV28100.1 hypothetical protein QI031_11740 [Halotia branconii CENA392]